MAVKMRNFVKRSGLMPVIASCTIAFTSTVVSLMWRNPEAVVSTEAPVTINAKSGRTLLGPKPPKTIESYKKTFVWRLCKDDNINWAVVRKWDLSNKDDPKYVSWFGCGAYPKTSQVSSERLPLSCIDNKEQKTSTCPLSSKFFGLVEVQFATAPDELIMKDTINLLSE